MLRCCIEALMLFAVAGVDDAATLQFSRDSLPEDRCDSPPAVQC